jgi:tetratricopeptide (TPR) repeat protein
MRLRVLLAVVLGVLLCSPGPLQSQDDAAARLLNLTSDSKSLPLWTKPKPQAAQDLAKQVKAIHPGIFIIGHPKGGYGTGFVVSQEHRLIATNAHVADILYSARSLLAIGNDSTQVFKVEQVWYHPGVIRDAWGIKLRLQDPSRGDVYSQCPDVALLRVGGKEKLPPALPLATPKELESLFAQPVGMLGFPGHDTGAWPGIGEEPQATYRAGVIARATDFDNDANAKTADLQFLQHTMANWFGFSGSPIFLTNGHVAAINNSARKAEKSGLTTTLAFGIRIDSLWELVGYHHLEDKLPLPVPVADLRLARFKDEDPGLKKYNRVWDRVNKVDLLMRQRKWVEAEKLLDEAFKIAPNYAPTHHRKSLMHSSWANTLPDAAALEHHELAVKHSKIVLLLEPNNVTSILTAAICIAELKQRRDIIRFGKGKDIPECAAIARNILALEQLLPGQKGSAYHLHTLSVWSARDKIRWLNKAIEINPFSSFYYYFREGCYKVIGERRKAAADRAKADTFKKASLLLLKSKLATQEKDRAEALRLAQEACQLTDYRHPMSCYQLGVAYHNSGDYVEAVHSLEKASKLMESWPDCEEKAGLARHLAIARNWAAKK